MAKKQPEIDFTQLRGINSAADFYGWKAHIIEAIAKTDTAYAARLETIGSLMDFFNLKEEILQRLNVSE